MPTLRLCLYIVSNAPNSIAARANLREILSTVAADSYTLEVVDCVADPHRALADGVFVTPTLLKLAPLPTQTIIGSLADRSSVVAALGLDAAGRANGAHE